VDIALKILFLIYLVFVRQYAMQTTLLFLIYVLQKKRIEFGIIMALLVNIKIKACYLFYSLILMTKKANLSRIWEDYLHSWTQLFLWQAQSMFVSLVYEKY